MMRRNILFSNEAVWLSPFRIGNVGTHSSSGNKYKSETKWKVIPLAFCYETALNNKNNI